MGKGVTEDRIYLGLFAVDIATFAATAGPALGGSFGDNDGHSRDSRAQSRAIVDYVNAQGGMAGRMVEPVYYEYPTANLFTTEGRRRAEQEQCEHWTQDNQVFAMLPAVSMEGVLQECAARTETPAIAVSSAEASVDEQRFNEVGDWWYQPNSFAAERRERTLVSRLQAQGFFEPAAKVGLLIYDAPVYRRGAARALEPALAEANVDVVTAAIYGADTVWQNVVLQFVQAGVTHVIWSHCPCSGAAQAFFMRAAEEQRYRPRHALASDLLLAYVRDLAPPEQLPRAAGMAWSPHWDGRGVPAGDEPITSSEAVCRQIARDAGLSDMSYLDWLAFMNICEGLLFIKAAVDRAPVLTSNGFRSAVEALGDSYVAVTSPASHFGPGRHDGTAAVWDLEWDPRCRCFVYAGGPHKVG